MSKCDTCEKTGCFYRSSTVIDCGKYVGMPKTNADRIRATDDELATILHAVKMGYRPWCDYHCENEGDDGCENCIKKWLQQPAEGETNEN